MSMFRRFLAGRKLELCAEKTKMLVFNRKGRKKRKFRDRKKIIEKIQTFKYLNFMLNKKENYREQIKELARKKRMTVRKI